MIYKGNFSYCFSCLRSFIKVYFNGFFSIVHEFTYQVNDLPLVITFFADRVR